MDEKKITYIEAKEIIENKLNKFIELEEDSCSRMAYKGVLISAIASDSTWNPSYDTCDINMKTRDDRRAVRNFDIVNGDYKKVVDKIKELVEIKERKDKIANEKKLNELKLKNTITNIFKDNFDVKDEYGLTIQNKNKKFGIKKCEANAIIPMPDIARDFVDKAITNFLGDDALERFANKREAVVEELSEFKEKTGLQEALQNALDLIDEENEE